MSLLASETQKKVAACRSALEAVEQHLEPLLAKDPPEISRQLAPLEHAELQVSLAYAVGSLYFCHLLTQGVDPAGHPLKQELDRVQLYFKKVRAAADEAKRREAGPKRGRGDLLQRMGQEALQTTAEAAGRQRGGEAGEGSGQPAPGHAGSEAAEVAAVYLEAAEAEQRPKKLRKKVRKKSAGAAA